MIVWAFLLGALSAIYGLTRIIRTAIGIRRGQRALYGSAARHGQHGHQAVREGLLRMAVGFIFLLLGIGIVLVAALHAG